MIAPAEAPAPAAQPSRSPGRIIGLDVARALAMLGMVIVHYIWPDESGGAIDTLAAAMLGRAMPLFMLLGGIGVTLAAARSANPDRSLLIRAVLLFVLGLVLHEMSAWVAVVLQSYGLFFLLAPALRRLPNPALLVTSALVAIAGAWTYQVMGTSPRVSTAYADLDQPIQTIRSLVVDGYYPFFPVAAFFILGMWIGRLDLRSDRVAGWLAAVGLVVGVGAIVATGGVIDALDVDAAAFDTARQAANLDGFDTDRFFWERLLDLEGHGQMPAWVISAAGTSVAVVGLSLLAAPRAGIVASPFVSLGRMALTFYAFQVVLTNVVPSPRSSPFDQELFTVLAIYFGFMVVAHLWLLQNRAGPLEALLRIGSEPISQGRRPPERG